MRRLGIDRHVISRWLNDGYIHRVYPRVYAVGRRALAVAEYSRLLDAAALREALGPGQPGSAQLRKALDEYLPRLALTRSPLEDQFFALCEAKGIPLPEVNPRIEGVTVDALWRK